VNIVENNHLIIKTTTYFLGCTVFSRCPGASIYSGPGMMVLPTIVRPIRSPTSAWCLAALQTDAPQLKEMDSHLIAEMEYRHWLTVLDSLSLEVVESAGTSNLHTLVQLPPESDQTLGIGS
jgi:hypothetical protein